MKVDFWAQIRRFASSFGISGIEPGVLPWVKPVQLIALPFAIAGLWENRRHPQSGEWIRTFAIITVPANALVAQIHDRMPLIQKGHFFVGEAGKPRFDSLALPAEGCVSWQPGSPVAMD